MRHASRGSTGLVFELVDDRIVMRFSESLQRRRAFDSRSLDGTFGKDFVDHLKGQSAVALHVAVGKATVAHRHLGLDIDLHEACVRIEVAMFGRVLVEAGTHCDDAVSILEELQCRFR